MYRKPLSCLLAILFLMGMLAAANLLPAFAINASSDYWVNPPYTKDYPPNSGLPTNYVYAVKTNNGQVWCCSAEGTDTTAVGGLSKYVGGPWRQSPEWITYDDDDGLPDKRVRHFDFDASGNIWVATEKGICRISQSGSILTNCPSALKEQPITYLAVNRSSGDVWTAKGSKTGNPEALYHFDGTNWTRHDSLTDPYPNGPFNWTINAIALDSHGDVWLGTSFGVSKYDVSATKWKNYTITNSTLPSPKVDAIRFDGSGNALIGMSKTTTSPGGAVKLDPSTDVMTPYDYLLNWKGGKGVDVKTITWSSKESDWIWFGTFEGVFLLDKSKPADEQWQLIHSGNSGLPNNHVRGIAYDSLGYIWFATLSGGLGRLWPKGGVPPSPGPGPTPDETITPTPDETITPTPSETESVVYQGPTQRTTTAATPIEVLTRTGLDLLPYLGTGFVLIALGLACRYGDI